MKSGWRNKVTCTCGPADSVNVDFWQPWGIMIDDNLHCRYIQTPLKGKKNIYNRIKHQEYIQPLFTLLGPHECRYLISKSYGGSSSTVHQMALTQFKSFR